jgi:sn-glycerol 3-phosphate transport system permease protein
MQNAQTPQTIPTVPAPDAILDVVSAGKETRPRTVGGSRGRRRIGGTIGTFLLALLGITWALPLLWSIAVALRPADVSVATGSPWWGDGLTVRNFTDAWERIPFGQYFLNTFVIVLGVLAVQLVTISLAGFAFARLTFPGRDVLFVLILMQILVPTNALIVPNYATIRRLHLFDTKLAIMLPFFASAFGTFFLRQTFKQVPRELDDASVLDGAAWWQTLWHVYLPSARAALVAFSLVSISFHWSDFLWPLIVTNSDSSRPVTVGLNTLTQMGESGAQWALVMAGTLLVISPLLGLFVIFQRQFMSSFLHSGIR